MALSYSSYSQRLVTKPGVLWDGVEAGHRTIEIQTILLRSDTQLVGQTDVVALDAHILDC